ncbi:MAG TPA: TetR family transcriptional regulator [Solirubrobacteraceae bacterium]|nr:TetR family transcriptional regulator [Solirubrobacteraceae bacterium]
MAAAAPPGTSRERIVFAGAELFRRQGYAATGVKQIVAEAQAPFGSLYHHFPGGKEQLADEVLRTGGAFFLALYRSIIDQAPDLSTGVRAFFAGAAETLEVTDFQDACPIATVAGEVASANDTLRRATADVFESWSAALAGDLRAAGAQPADARAAALAVLAQLEGAFLLSRSLRSTDPMHAAAGAAVAGLTALLDPPTLNGSTP